MAASRIRVALAQLPGAGGTLEERVATAERALGEDADLVVFPEAYLPGYAHRVADAAGVAREVATRGARGRSVAMGFLTAADGGACELGLATPGGGWVTYRKRFPSPDERRVWRPGGAAVVAGAPFGRVGLLVCADVLQRAAWRDLRRRVDLVVVSAAWPDYGGRAARVSRATAPLVRWLAGESGPYRDDLLSRAARYVGAPVVFVNAVGEWRDGEGFSGGSSAWSAAGERLVAPVVGEVVVGVEVPLGGAASLDALVHPPPWEALTAAWRVAGRIPTARWSG